MYNDYRFFYDKLFEWYIVFLVALFVKDNITYSLNASSEWDIERRKEILYSNSNKISVSCPKKSRK